MRGYFGIGVENAKKESNIGTLWRSAYCFGASFIFTIGHRYSHQASDTTKAWRHIPLFEFDSAEDFFEHTPRDCPIIGVELTEHSETLETFEHPERAIYLLGPEDGSLSKDLQKTCTKLVQFDSTHCLNVASAGTVVLYDRRLKLGKEST